MSRKKRSWRILESNDEKVQSPWSSSEFRDRNKTNIRYKKNSTKITKEFETCCYPTCLNLNRNSLAQSARIPKSCAHRTTRDTTKDKLPHFRTEIAKERPKTATKKDVAVVMFSDNSDDHIQRDNDKSIPQKLGGPYYGLGQLVAVDQALWSTQGDTKNEGSDWTLFEEISVSRMWSPLTLCDLLSSGFDDVVILVLEKLSGVELMSLSLVCTKIRDTALNRYYEKYLPHMLLIMRTQGVRMDKKEVLRCNMGESTVTYKWLI
jgi:hypothetical protein